MVAIVDGGVLSSLMPWAGPACTHTHTHTCTHAHTHDSLLLVGARREEETRREERGGDKRRGEETRGEGRRRDDVMFRKQK